tara:strand:+ start:1699 stop:2160 length:462 start_codon:yes stop_codon:yes gene_type:complete
MTTKNSFRNDKIFLFYRRVVSDHTPPKMTLNRDSRCRMSNIQEKSFATSKKYFDDRNFPRGFQRAGDFTRAQAIILETKGVALKELHEGVRQPETDEEVHFVATCLGQEQPQTDVEKAWASYVKALQRKQIYFTASSAAVSDGGGSDDMDDDD